MEDVGNSGGTALFGWTGRRSLTLGAYLLDLTVFILHALSDWFRRGHLFDRVTRQSMAAQIVSIGVGALPVVTLLALALSLSITSEILALGQTLGSAHSVQIILVNIVGVELSPLLTAIVLIGRSGSAITVELGGMQLRGEVQGLVLLGINITDFFVAPRILGAAVAQFTLAVYCAAIALFGGVFLDGLLFATPQTHQLVRLAAILQASQVVVFVLKNLLFGIIIAGVACFNGLRVHTSPTDLSLQTRRAIVTSLILVFLADGLLAVMSR